MPPTANPPVPSAGEGPYAAPVSQPMPVPPTANPGYSRAASQSQQGATQGPGGRFYTPQAPPPSGNEKAFSGVPAYSSGVSPYLNLFRGGGGGADNYNTLVRPQLDQQRANQRFGQDLFGLQRQAAIQQAMSQRAPPRPVQNVGTPQYFMNYGGYYQGNQGWNWYGGGYGGSPYPPAGYGRW
jgi:hypothetical protein